MRCACAAELTARHRVRFLQLTDVFLASRLVPAYTVAAFAKRFARLALTAPPPGALVCVAFVHNLVRRHPACICLLHNPSPTLEGGSAGEGVFDNACEDPAESRAIESRWDWTRCGYVNPLVRYPLLLLLRHATTSTAVPCYVRLAVCWMGSQITASLLNCVSCSASVAVKMCWPHRAAIACRR
jgi:hypothetical protein